MIQRGDSALRLNVHFHVLVLDGVYVRETEGGALVFHPLASRRLEKRSSKMLVHPLPVARRSQAVEGGVRTHEGHGLDQALCSEHAVERISVRTGESPGELSVLE